MKEKGRQRENSARPKHRDMWRETTSTLRSALNYASSEIKTILREAEKQFREEMKVQGEDGFKKIMDQHNELRYYAAAIRENMEKYRNELTKAYYVLDSADEKKSSTKGFARQIEEFEQELRKYTDDAVETERKMRKREKQLIEALKVLQPEKETPEPIDFRIMREIKIENDGKDDEIEDMLGRVANMNVNENVRNRNGMINILGRSNLLELPRFNGNITEWGPFWDLFKVLVHDTSDPDVLKFTALRNSCTGRAAEMLKRYSQDGSAYNEAIERFLRIYDSEQTRFKGLYDKLKAVKTVRENLREIRTTFNTVHAIINQIARIQQDIDTDAFLVEVRYKFPRSVLEQVARIEKEKYNGKITKMKDLLKEIEDYIYTQEIVQGEYLGDGEIGNERVFNIRGNKINEQTKCKFCGRTNHKTQDCLQVRNQNDRRQFIMEKKLCYNCMSTGHNAGSCRAAGCRICSGKHHTAICEKKPVNNQNRNNFQTNFRGNNRGRPANGNQSRGRNFNQNPNYRNNDQYRNRSNDKKDRNDRDGRNDRNDRNSRERSRSNESRSNSRSRSRTPDRGRQTIRDNRWKPRRDDTPRRRAFTVQCTVQTRTSRLISTELPIWGDYNSNEYERADVLFDTGAEDTFISKALANRLKAKVINPEVRMNLTYFTGEAEKVKCQEVVIYLRMEKPRKKGDEEIFKTIKAYTIDFITKPVETEALEWEDAEFMKQNGMKISQKNDRMSEIQLLIGNNYYHKLVDNTGSGPVDLPSGLTAIKTRLEDLWIPFGKRGENDSSVMTVKNDDDFVEKFTELEWLGINEKEESNEQIIQRFEETVEITEKGEIYVEFPWKDGMREELYNNKPLAHSRFLNFVKSPKTKLVWDEVVKQINEQEKLNIIEEVKDTNSENPIYYIPYQTVTNLSSNTTKVRIVLDCSAHVKGKRSLNQSIYQGPSLLPDLWTILLRTRCARNVLICDVAKAFWQIRLKEKERDATRFLWLKDTTKAATPDNIRELRFCRVPFGLNVAPFLLEKSISYYTERSSAEEWLKTAIKDLLYVDNLFLLFDKAEELKEKYEKSKAHFKKLAMNIREYSSNAVKELAKIPEIDRSKASNQKLLGYIWQNEKDTISIKIPKLSDKKELSRRDAIKYISAVFDPLGIIGPLLNECKEIIPELFKETSSWEGKITQELTNKLKKFEKKISKYQYEFPRYILSPDSAKFSIAIFSDSSDSIFATVAYILSENSKGKHSALLASKQRLAPRRKKQTIPRLELLGIWLAAKLARILIDSLDLKIAKVHFLSDSEIALAWIANESESKVFIQNRVDMIRKTSREIQDRRIEVSFGHVATDLNVADLATKGIHDLEDLRKLKWFSGPDFLKMRDNEWPVANRFSVTEGKNEQKIEAGIDVVQKEITKSKVCAVTTEKLDKEFGNRLSFGVTNNWRRIIRHTGYCLKFLKKRVANRLKSAKLITKLQTAVPELYQIKWDGQTKFLTIEEREASERFIYRNHQAEYEIKEDRDKNWKMDKNGLILLDTRLGNSIKQKYMHRVIINPISKLGTIIILDLHERNFHAGLRTLLGMIYERYAGRRWQTAIKSTLKRCMRCSKKHNHPFPMPEAPDLQDRRVQPAHHPFEHCGMDFFGPVYLRMDDDSIIKSYILIITCMSTRNIHLESMYSLSTAEFLLSIRRFVCTYGCPSSITTDNGLTFKLASKVINEQATIDKSLERAPGDIRIKWYFNVPASPWQGGHFERLVAIAKKALKNAIQKNRMTKSIFDTLIREVCVVINSRPLVYIDEGDFGGYTVRPIDILHPEFRSMNLQTESDVSEVDTALSQYREVKAYMERFWSVWEQYYLPQRNFLKLRPSQKASSKQRTPEVDELVLVKSDNEPRDKWKIGRITRLIVSPDGNVRSAEVRVQNPDKRRNEPKSHEITRTVNNLIPLCLKGTKNREKEKKKVSFVEPEKELTDDHKNDSKNTHQEKRRGRQKKELTEVTGERKPYHQTAYRTRSSIKREQSSTNFVRCTDRQPQERSAIPKLKNWIFVVAIFGLFGSTLGSTPPNLYARAQTYEHGRPYAASRMIEIKEFSGEQGDGENRITHRVSPLTKLPTSPKPKTTKVKPTTTRLKTTTGKLKFIVKDGRHIPVEEFEDRQLIKQYELQQEEKGKVRHGRRGVGNELDSFSAEEIHSRKRHQEHHKNVERNNVHPSEEGTRMECTNSGIKLFNNDVRKNERYTVCSESHCVGPIEAAGELEVDFPSTVTSKRHSITWRKSGGDSYQILTKNCPAKEFCTVNDCSICLAVLYNPHCHETAFIAMIVILILLLTIPCLVIKRRETLRQSIRCIWHSAFMRLTRRICRVGLLYIGAGFDAIRWIFCWMRRKRAEGKRKRAAKRRDNEEIELFSFESSRKSRPGNRDQKLGIMRSPSADSIYEQKKSDWDRKNKRVRWLSNDTSSRRSSWGSVKVISGLAILTCLFSLGNCCDRFIPISHDEKTCTNNVCKIATTNELFLSPRQKSICLTAATKEHVVAKIEVNILYSVKVCKKGVITYAYNSTSGVSYAKKCHAENVCNDYLCQATRPNTKIPDIGPDNELLGKSYCTSSCGGWFCGCLSFAEGCMFYRTTAKKNNDHRFQLYSCDQWSHELAISVTVESGAYSKLKKSTHKYLMREGESDMILDERNRSIGNLTLISSEESYGYDMSKFRFIQSGTKVGLRSSTEEDIPLQCDEKDDCSFIDTCKCTGGSSSPNCDCKNLDLFKATSDGLPIIKENYQLLVLDGTVPALKFWNTRNHLQITFQTTYSIATEITSQSCEILDYGNLHGCYNCEEAAQFSVTCKSMNESSAIISCSNREFFERLVCNQTGYENIIYRSFNRSSIHELCQVRCGGKVKHLEIEGNLHFVPPPNLESLFQIGTKQEDKSKKSFWTMPDFVIHGIVVFKNIIYLVGSSVLVVVLVWILLRYILPLIIRAARGGF